METRRKNKYCSINCQKEHEYKEYVEKWKSGKSDGLRGEYQISNHLRRYLFEKIITNVNYVVGEKEILLLTPFL